MLLVRARGGYGNTISAQLAAAGFDDLPRNGPFVLGGLGAPAWPAFPRKRRRCHDRASRRSS